MRDTIIIVDDVDINRDILENILEDEYRIVTAQDGINALETIDIEKERLCAILLDLVMPNMDGYEVLVELKERNIITNIPVLIISSEESTYSEQECFSAGVSDFIHKPFDRGVVKTRVNNTVNLYLYKRHLEETVEEQTNIIRKKNNNVVDLLASVVESRDLECGVHVKRVKEYTKILANRLSIKYPEYKLTDETIDTIVAASVLHDIGKIAIPDAILLKPDRLSTDEFDKMKTHTTIGAEFIEKAKDMWEDDFGEVSLEIAKYHHEKFDGKGYPEGLKGNDIPIAAQIVSLADVYDALVSKRCYKEAFTKEKAFDMVLRGECGQFNPDLIECFIDEINKFEDMTEKIA